MSVVLYSDEFRLGVIGLSNSELAGSHRKTFRRQTDNELQHPVLFKPPGTNTINN